MKRLLFIIGSCLVTLSSFPKKPIYSGIEAVPLSDIVVEANIPTEPITIVDTFLSNMDSYDISLFCSWREGDRPTTNNWSTGQIQYFEIDDSLANKNRIVLFLSHSQDTFTITKRIDRHGSFKLNEFSVLPQILLNCQKCASFLNEYLCSEHYSGESMWQSEDLEGNKWKEVAFHIYFISQNLRDYYISKGHCEAK